MYGYGNTNWGDLLTSYDGQTITYDAIGNPLNDGTWTYTWEHGRQLASMTDGTTTWSYTYDANGMRTGMTVVTEAFINDSHVHSYIATSVTEPTCTARGYTTYTCLCGAHYNNNFVAALGHSFNDGFVISLTCVRCGATQGSGLRPASESEPEEDVALASTVAEGTAVATKTVDYSYVYNGSQLVQETITTTVTSYGETTTTTKTLNYYYDASGTPMYVTLNGTPYYYVLNLQGDVTALLNSSGTAVVKYTYDAWGNPISVSGSLASSLGKLNALRYRGYVYDTESELYYLQSRYYDPEVGRFINADTYTSTGQGLLGNNMFAYCNDNPVILSDYSGHWPILIKFGTEDIEEFFETVADFFLGISAEVASNHEKNRRPYRGEPGSTYKAPNGDTRTYGPDGYPEHDYDHDDHGNPNNHPHDPNGGHNHDWVNRKRGPAYSVGIEPIAGAALVTVCTIGVVVIVADNATGVGIMDDFLLGPLGAGVGEGLLLLFG